MNKNGKATAIMIMSIISIILSIGVVAIFIIYFLNTAWNINAYYSGYSFYSDSFGTTFYFLIIAVIMLIVNLILCWTSVIMVFATKWPNPAVQNDRILWGLLSIFLIGSIGTLIFSIKARKSYAAPAPVEVDASNGIYVL